MILVEKQIVTPKDSYYKTLLGETRKSKDLRNAALFVNRQHCCARHGKYFIEDIASDVDKNYVPWPTVDKLLKKNNHPAYKAMLANSAQETLKLVDQEYASFFALIKLKAAGLYSGKVRVPNYSDKDGHYPVVYNQNQLSRKYIEKGQIRIPKTDVVLSGFVHLDKMRQLRIIPKNGYIVVELSYRVEEVPELEDNGRCASIDVGVDILTAIYSNVAKSFLISGGPLKSINHYYNSKLAELKSLLAQNKNTVVDEMTGEIVEQRSSHATERLQMTRDNKINDYLHKASALIVQFLLTNKINTLIVGHTKGWKQSTRMRHKSKESQNFQFIPFNRFFFMLQYKCRMHGIRFILQEESYTSKASAFDGDFIPTYDENVPKEVRKTWTKFSGRRVKRGLYKTKDGIRVNADINGAANALRKYLQEVRDATQAPADIGLVMNPVQASVLFQVIRPRVSRTRKDKGTSKETLACAKRNR